MKNISGNFDTTSQELEIVKEYLKDKKIDYLSVEKYNEADAGDVIVKFKNGYISLFEVKEESIARWEKYHQYGIDFISSFQFKKDVNKSDFQGIKNPKDLPKLLRAIDANFIKWGKIYYSYSDIWLFYVKDKNENIIHLEAYNVNELEKTFFKYLSENCQYSVNNKSENQLSNSDTFQSATFFVKPEILELYRVKKIEDLYHNIEFRNQLRNLCIKKKSED